MDGIPECFYRVSVCALVLDESRTRFLAVKERNDWWAIPGGGVEWGESFELALAREIREEMGLSLVRMQDTPAYVTIGQRNDGTWALNAVYEAELEHLRFTESDECTEVRFVTPEESRALQAYHGLQRFAEAFDPARHARP